jgi:hypothetical protein
MDTKMLLRFLTASDLMLYNSEGNFFKIQVKIVDLEGIARRPVAHTNFQNKNMFFMSVDKKSKNNG